MTVQNPNISIIIRNLYNSSSNRGSARIILKRNYPDPIIQAESQGSPVC